MLSEINGINSVNSKSGGNNFGINESCPSFALTKVPLGCVNPFKC